MSTLTSEQIQKAKRVLGAELARRGPAEIAQARKAVAAQRAIDTFFPDSGPYRRELYPRHMEFIGATAHYREIMVRFGNQTGKTTIGCYADSTFLTGQYPPWWNGRRYDRPIKMWACAETSKKVREVLQEKLFGGEIRQGYSTGLIPGACVGRPAKKSGTVDAIDFIPIRHISGAWSKLVFKSYEEGWQSFESDVVDVVHLDEEPDEKVYGGALMRTITKPDGLLYITVTPLMGISPLQQKFMGAAQSA